MAHSCGFLVVECPIVVLPLLCEISRWMRTWLVRCRSGEWLYTNRKFQALLIIVGALLGVWGSTWCLQAA